MSDFRWTLDDLRVAEEAVQRHHDQIASGERTRGPVRTSPRCERACTTCDLQCAVMVGCVETIRLGLAEQERRSGPVWELRHAGLAYADVQGRA